MKKSNCRVITWALLILSYTLSLTIPLQAQDGHALPEGRVGKDYHFIFRGEGGIAPLRWSIKSGNLPAGLNLDSSGKLSGIPTSIQQSAYRFTVEVSDSSTPPETFEQTFILMIKPAPLKIVLSSEQGESAKLKIVNPQFTSLSLDVDTDKKTVQQVREKAEANASPSKQVSPNDTPITSTNTDPPKAKAKEDELKKKVTVTGQLLLASMKDPLRSRTKNSNRDLGVFNVNQALSSLKDTPYDKLDEVEKKQKTIIENYLGNISVQALDDKDAIAAIAFTDENGKFRLKLESGKRYSISTGFDNYHTTRDVYPVDEEITVNIPIEDRPVSLLTRAIVGFSQAGASSAKNDQNYFFDLFVSQSVPFPQKVSPDFGERWKIWGDVRVGSVPQKITDGIGTFSTTFVQNAANLKVNEAVQVVDFLAGVEFRIKGNAALLPSFDRETKQKFSLSMIAAFGTSTPINPNDTIAIYNLPMEVEGKKYIAYVSSDRDRFFRQYYAGFRFSTYFFNRTNIPMQRFPAMFDVMYGQNEYVTGGRAHGGIFRIDGYMPLPYDGLKFVNLFYTAMLRPGRTNIVDPVVLEPAPEGTKIHDAQTLIVTLPQFKRDYYRVGIGIDFLSFIQTLKSMGAKK